MSWATLTASYHPSDVVVIAAGLLVVITSGVRTLFKWLEFRAFMNVWRELARHDSDMGLQYFSEAMRAFRYRVRQLMAHPQVAQIAPAPPLRGRGAERNKMNQPL